MNTNVAGNYTLTRRRRVGLNLNYLFVVINKEICVVIPPVFCQDKGFEEENFLAQVCR